jgi:hypothetical protein
MACVAKEDFGGLLQRHAAIVSHLEVFPQQR